MAQLFIELSKEDSELKLKAHKKIDQLYDEFIEKWDNIIAKFDGKFINEGCIISDDYGITVNTGEFSNKDDGEPNFDRAVCMFLENVVEFRGTGNDWSIGQDGFPDEFYFDLYKLHSYSMEITDLGLSYDEQYPSEIDININDRLSKDVEWHIKNPMQSPIGCDFFNGKVTIDSSGYYTLYVKLTPYGLILSSDFYEAENDEDYDDEW